MKFAGLSVITLIFLFGTSAAAETVVSKIYEKGRGRERALFTQEIQIETSGAREVHRSSIRTADADAQPVFTDEMRTENGRLIRYDAHHHQLAERWSAEVKDGTVHYRREILSSGKTEADAEKIPDDFLIGPMIVPYLVQNWRTLEKGETLSVRLGVLQRQETIGFKFFKAGEAVWGTKKAVKILMKPTSVLIAALVDPIEFHFTPEDRKLVYTVGRTQLRFLKNGEWRDLTAETVFSPP